MNKVTLRRIRKTHTHNWQRSVAGKRLQTIPENDNRERQETEGEIPNVISLFSVLCRRWRSNDSDNVLSIILMNIACVC